MELSHGGLLGALIGLALAAIEFFVVKWAALGPNREVDTAKLVQLRLIILPSFVVLPIVFYFVGDMLTGQLAADGWLAKKWRAWP
jgi:hypothetical protein